MLKILVSGIDPIPEDAIMDAEKAFAMSSVRGDEIDRLLIKTIEKGEYLNPYEFIDRFGYKLSTLYMSTGCQAALAVHNRPDLVINCTEAGDDALSEIIKYCENGTIIVPNRLFVFCTVGNDDIDVLYRGYRYTSFNRFASYMYDEWPDVPEVFEDDEGVEKFVQD